MTHHPIFQKLRNSFSFFGFSFFCILLTILLIPLLYLPMFRDGFDLPKEILLYTTLSLIFILSLFEIIKTKTFFYKRTVLDKPFLFLAGVGLISTIFSKSSSLSFWGRGDTFVFHFFALFLFLAWSWFLIQKIKSEKLFRVATVVFLLSGTIASLFFLIQKVNVVANLNSIFGIYAVTLLTLSLGALIPQGKKLTVLSFVSLLCALSSSGVIYFLNFQVVWVFVCIATALLFLIGMAFWGGIRKTMLGLVFFLFLFSLIRVLLPGFLDFGRALPTEVNLSPGLSKTIVESALTSDTKNFLFGSGPGTFVYDFSLFRPQSLNQNSYFWSVRFDAPWSSLFSWVSEFGFVGTVGLLLIFLLILGSILSAILHIRSTFWKRAKFLMEKITFSDFRFEYFVFMIAWILLTVGICVSVYTFALWFVWWTMLSFVVVGLSYIQPSLVREHEKTFEINPQYIFVFSFFFLLMSSATVVGGVLWGKVVMSEYLVFQAQKEPARAEILFQSALLYQPQSSDILLLLARNYLEESIQLSSTNAEESARLLSRAIDFARQARDVDPNTVRVYEVLSRAYLQTLPYTSELSRQQSLVWATDAINHAFALEPTNPTFYSQMGMLQEFSGQLDAAKLSYQDAIRMKPDYPEGYFELSRLYEKQNDLNHAIDTYEQYLSFDRKNADVLYELGRLYYNRKTVGDEAKAEALWLSALEIAPNSSNTLYSLGLLYERHGGGERVLAKEYFKKVKALNPDNQDVDKKLQSL